MSLRRGGRAADCTGLENRSPTSVKPSHADTSEDPEKNLAFCLALLAQKSADLALVVERWERLPEPIRAGIVAMVKATLEAESGTLDIASAGVNGGMLETGSGATT
jgi:hypothetical protein